MALWHDAPRVSTLRPAALGEGVRVRAAASLISRGTERLVWEGRVPERERDRMRAPFQEGAFPFPVKYGYALAGIAETGDLAGRPVFALHPHQSIVSLPPSALTPLPTALPLRRACLAANMETALNALWDAGAGPGDRIAVIGAGLVGCLVARLAARLPGAEVALTDKIAARADVASQLNVSFASAPPKGCDIAFHCSATGAGLSAAMECLGPEGRLVDLSWYGDRQVEAPLGACHSFRLTLTCSQVGEVSPSRRPRWGHARRLAKAVDLLDDPALDALITDEVRFADLPARLPGILAPDAPGIATIVTYED